MSGELLVDGTYGTAISQSFQSEAGPKVVSLPVKWPHGYSGRPSGGELEVVNASGEVVARTGTRVYLMGGSEGDNPRTWVTCGVGPLPPE